MTIARLLIPLLLLSLAPQAFALRCGNKLVNDGDPKAKVLKYCGEPESVERRTVVRSGIPRRLWQLKNDGHRAESSEELLVHQRSYVEVSIEEWTYNFGPRKLMRLVTFENGRVRDVKTLGYGYHD